ncbi:uncharacterized protein LOC111108330 isoform X2 [Crassostrea virginica]
MVKKIQIFPGLHCLESRKKFTKKLVLRRNSITWLRSSCPAGDSDAAYETIRVSVKWSNHFVGYWITLKMHLEECSIV